MLLMLLQTRQFRNSLILQACCAEMAVELNASYLSLEHMKIHAMLQVLLPLRELFVLWTRIM